MMRVAFTFAATCLLAASGARAQSVVLSAKPGSGVDPDREETTTIEMKEGKMQLSVGSQILKGSAKVLLRDQITRTFKSADEQEIEFHECTRSILFSFDGMNGDPKLSGGQLAGRKVTGRREDGGWKFRLAEGKPTPAEEKALKQFSAFNVALESMGNLYGDEPREVGKPWRPDFTALTSALPGLSVTIDCRVDEMMEREGVPCAKIAIGGLVKASYGEKSRLEVRFTGKIIRNLLDQLDLETELAGSIQFQGRMGGDGSEGGGNAAVVDAPLSLKRSLKVSKHRDAPR